MNIKKDKNQKLIISLDGKQINLDHNTEAKIKTYLDNLLGEKEIERPVIVPMSDGQKGLWFIYQMNPKNLAQNLYTTVKISSALDLKIWEETWQKIGQRHDILRTTYGVKNDELVQIVHSNIGVITQVIDGSNWSQEKLNNKILAHADIPFDLEHEAGIRVSLFKNSETEFFQLITMHHIAGDMWSLDLFLKEFESLYALLKPALPYQDFVSWQSQTINSSEGESNLQYWKQELSGELPILNLLTDKPRLSLQNYPGDSHRIKLNKDLVAKLRQLETSSGSSIYRIMLAVFYVFLYRYTGQEDILVGTPMANRWGQKEFKTIGGYCTNVVVLRASIKGTFTFQEFLAQVSHKVSQAQKHQNYPFSLLIENLLPQRDLSQFPLFSVALTWHRHRWYNLKQQEQSRTLQIEPYFLGEQRGTFSDLNLRIVEAGDDLQLSWEYKTNLFNPDTISRMATHYLMLLKDIINNLETPISQLPLLTEVESHQILVDWNNTAKNYPKDKCVHQLFEEQVERTPDAIAVVFEKQQLTYRELNNQANQLANYLHQLGVKPETLIGICVERSLEMIIGLLGVLKAGGAYVPLDPNYPQERLDFMLEDTQVSIILIQNHLLSKFFSPSIKFINIDHNWNIINQQSKEILSNNLNLTSHNLAYIIYTSGSTGQPKGVMMPHYALTNRILWGQSEAKLTTKDKVLQRAPFSFDPSINEVFSALISGAQLVIPLGKSIGDSRYLIDLIISQKITIMSLPPSLLRAILDEEKVTKCQSLKRVSCGAEALTMELVKDFKSKLPAKLFNVYGPTETCLSVTQWETNLEIRSNIAPIGRPIDNTKIYILDSQLQPVPIGVPGEIYIGGVGLARGYLNRSKLTAERFIKNPFKADGRLYKTGDLARYLPDGTIEFLGRIDHQVKIRGFRIELGEIETLLTQHPKIRETVVIVRENARENQVLVAYFIPTSEYIPSSIELREFLSRKLPHYMIPNVFIPLEQFPLTINGKIDLQNIPLASQIKQDTSDILLTPQDQLEQDLMVIWEEVLGIKPIRITDNFFELGGHSLLAVKLIHLIVTTTTYKLSLGVLFENPTIEKIAQNLRNNPDFFPWNFLISIQPKGDKPPLFAIHNEIQAYHNLACYLGEEQPIYGLSDPRFVQEVVLSESSIDTLATNYLEEIQHLQPCGPYYLIGISFGGIVAFEIAQHLLTKGEKVAFLGLLDSSAPNFCKSLSLRQKFQIHWQELVEKGIFTYINNRINSQSNKLNKFVNRQKLATKIDQNKEKINELAPSAQADVFNFINKELMTNYVARPYWGKITLFKAQQTKELIDRHPRYFDEKLGWGNIAKKGLDILRASWRTHRVIGRTLCSSSRHKTPANFSDLRK